MYSHLPSSIGRYPPPPTLQPSITSSSSTSAYATTTPPHHHQYLINNSNSNNGLNNSFPPPPVGQSNQFGFQQNENNDLNKKALTLLFRVPSKTTTSFNDSKCYATSGVDLALHYHDSSNHHSKNMFAQQQQQYYQPGYMVQNMPIQQQPVNNTTNMYNQFNPLYPTSVHAQVNTVSTNTMVPHTLLSKTTNSNCTTTFHNNIESGVLSNTTNVTSIKTINHPEQISVDQKVVSSNNLQSFNEIIGMIDEKKKRKDNSEQEQNKKRKKESSQLKEEDEEEELEEEVEEDFVNGSSTEKLLPIRALAHLVGLSKDEGKTWRYRDVRRALFEKTTKEHSNFIEKNQQHSILRQRLPHKLTLVSFCKRIMLLVFHFIIRDGREPKFFIRTHVKKDLIENTLEGEAPEFYKKINCNIAMKIHAFICTGLSIEQASKNVLQNLPQGSDKSAAVTTVNVTQSSSASTTTTTTTTTTSNSSTGNNEQQSSNVEQKASPTIFDSPTNSPTLPSLSDLLKHPIPSGHGNCQSCPHCKQEI